MTWELFSKLIGFSLLSELVPTTRHSGGLQVLPPLMLALVDSIWFPGAGQVHVLLLCQKVTK